MLYGDGEQKLFEKLDKQIKKHHEIKLDKEIKTHP